MADIKFSCPQCQQHIAADAGYAGIQINCPGCNAAMIVPGAVVAAEPAVVAAPSTPAGPRLRTQPSSQAAATCPSCGGALAAEAVLCVSCGYNLSTGRRMTMGQPAARRPAVDQWETPWYKTPYPYVGVVFAVLGLVYFFGRNDPRVMLALIGIAALYCLCVQIMVIVAGFRYGVGTGFLTLCVPFYALYFVFKVHDNDALKVLYGGVVIINIALRVLAASLK